MSDLPEYRLNRRFNAAPHLVWRTWTEPELLAHWYGPGVETVIHKLDVTPGGLWLNEMRMGGSSMYQKAEYREVVDGARLVMVMSTTDENWEISTNPRMPDWPRTLWTDVSFTADGDGTALELIWTPHEASEAEIACFAGAVSGAGQGWEKGMDLLEEMLADLA